MFMDYDKFDNFNVSVIILGYILPSVTKIGVVFYKDSSLLSSNNPNKKG